MKSKSDDTYEVLGTNHVLEPSFFTYLGMETFLGGGIFCRYSGGRRTLCGTKRPGTEGRTLEALCVCKAERVAKWVVKTQGRPPFLLFLPRAAYVLHCPLHFHLGRNQDCTAQE